MRRLPALALTLLLLLCGCTTAGDTPPEQSQPDSQSEILAPESSVPPLEPSAAPDPAGEPTDPLPEPLDQPVEPPPGGPSGGMPLTTPPQLARIMLEALEPGLSLEEVRLLAVSEPVELTGAATGERVLRYDVLTADGYAFADGGLDQVDLEGMREEQITLILFVTPDDADRVAGFTIYYYDVDSGEIHRLDADGADQLVSP